MDSGEGEVATGVKLEKHAFTWRIKNFNVIRHADELILAQEFSFRCGKTIHLETEWTVRLEVSKGNEDWVGIFLWCTKKPKNVKHVHGNAQYSIISSNVVEKFGNLEPKTIHDYATLKGWGFPTFIQKDGNKDGKDVPLLDGSLVVRIKFHLYAPASAPPILTTYNNITTQSIVEKFKPIFMEKLQSDFEGIDISFNTSDEKVKIVSSDKKEFGVSAATLSARSPVFRKALQVDMEEAKTGVISIDDLSSTPITVLLRFIYTGTLHAEWSKEDVVVPLVYAAEKYELLDLKDFLDNVLGKVCCTENAGKLLNLAGKIGMKKAAKDILERIKEDFSNHDDMVAVISGGSDLDF